MSEAGMAYGTRMGSLLLTPQPAQGGHANWAQEEQGVQSQQLQSICFQQEKELQVSCSHSNKGKHANNQGLDLLDLKLTPKVATFMLK